MDTSLCEYTSLIVYMLSQKALLFLLQVVLLFLLKIKMYASVSVVVVAVNLVDDFSSA